MSARRVALGINVEVELRPLPRVPGITDASIFNTSSIIKVVLSQFGSVKIGQGKIGFTDGYMDLDL